MSFCGPAFRHPMLTQQQIAAMTDDEADVFVASKILGMTWKSWEFKGEIAQTEDKDKDRPAIPYADDHGCWERDDRATGGIFESEWVNIPDSHSWTPACCIDDAMKVVKKMGLFVRLENNAKNEWGSEWVCIVGHVENLLLGTAATHARAICNAVIAAHEAKGK